jgi:signal transduction histidine kinase
MSNWPRLLLFQLILSLTSLLAFSQSQLQVLSIDSDKGLNSPVILSLRPDRGNLLWIGTYDGLYCFDGFQAFPVEIRHHATKEPITGSIDAIFPDSKGRYWIIIGRTKLGRLDPFSNLFYPIDSGEAEGYFFNIWESQGELWFNRINLPPVLFDPESKRFVEMAIIDKEGDKIRPDANLFLTYSGGKFYSLLSESFKEVQRGENLGEYKLVNEDVDVADTLVRQGYFRNHIDIRGNIWFRYAWDWSNWAVLDTIRNRDQTAEVMHKLGGQKVEEVYTTQQFSLFKTEAGYFLWELGKDNPVDINAEMHRLRIVDSNFGSFFESQKHGEFAYGFRRGRLDLLYLKKDFFRSMTAANGELHRDFMIGIYPFGKDRVIIRHDFADSVFTVIDQRTKKTEIMKSQKLAEMVGTKPRFSYPPDLDWRAWIGKFGKEILDFSQNQHANNIWTYEYAVHDGKEYRYLVDNGLRLIRLEDNQVIFPKLTPISLSYDEDFAWISTESEGLLSLHIPSGEIRQYLPMPNDPKSLPSERIYAAVPASDKYLWVATANGLAYMEKMTGICRVFNTGHGLPDNRIYSMAFDLEGDLWLGTGRGLSRMDTATKTFTNFTQSDGLVNSEFNRNSAMVLEDGMMLMGGIDGLDYFYPAQVPKSNSAPKPILAMVRNNNRMVDISRPGDFSFEQDYLTFHLSAKPIWLAAEQTFQYRLVGVDDNWNDLSNSNLVQYPTLRPGSYRFEFRIASQQETVTYEFTIHPPWYQSIWFRILAFLAFAGIVAIIARMVFVRRIAKLAYENELIRLKAEKEKTLAKERERITADLHDDVGATLSSLQIYGELARNMLSEEPEKGKELVEKIQVQSKELLSRMSDIVWSMKRPQDGNYTLASRILNYASELLTTKGIQLHVSIGEDLEERIVQPDVRKNLLLMIKESLNNIAKHSKATEASLDLKQKGEIVVLTIQDNGVGFDMNKPSQGNGLQNLKRRGKDLGGETQVFSQKEKGTMIILEFPIARISLD